MSKLKSETITEGNEIVETIGGTPAPASPTKPKPEAIGWMKSAAARGGEIVAEYPGTATLGFGIAAHQLSNRLVTPAIDKVVDKVSSTFGRAAEAKVEESLKEEAVAHATGSILDAAANFVAKAFTGVTE